MLKIGWSHKDVTTYEPVNIPGQFYAKIPRGVHDSVTITALYLEQDGEAAIFLSGDFVSFGDDIISDLRSAVAERNPEIPTDKIILFATHTHTSPSFAKNDILSIIPKTVLKHSSSPEYRTFLIDKMCEAILESFASLQEGGISYGYGSADIGFSRRVMYKRDTSVQLEKAARSSYWVDGNVKMYGETNDKSFSGYEASFDTLVNIMFTFDRVGTLTGAIINIPCPAQTSEDEYYISAGYWNEVREIIRKDYGDIFILPQCAAAGDTSPRMLHYSDAQKRKYRLKYENLNDRFAEIYLRYDIAEKIKAAFDEVYSWAKKEIFYNCDLKHRTKILPLQKRLITDEEYYHCKEKYEDARKEEFVSTDFPLFNIYRNSRIITVKNRYKNIIDRYESQKSKKTLDAEVHIVAIGDIAFCTNTFELFTDFQHRIQAQSPFVQTFIIQLCAYPKGFASGYLATERASENKGYSASMFSNTVSFEGGDTLCTETVKELKSLK